MDNANRENTRGSPTTAGKPSAPPIVPTTIMDSDIARPAMIRSGVDCLGIALLLSLDKMSHGRSANTTDYKPKEDRENENCVHVDFGPFEAKASPGPLGTSRGD